MTNRAQGQLVALTSWPACPVTNPESLSWMLWENTNKDKDPGPAIRGIGPWGHWICHRDKLLDVYEV